MVSGIEIATTSHHLEHLGQISHELLPIVTCDTVAVSKAPNVDLYFITLILKVFANYLKKYLNCLNYINDTLCPPHIFWRCIPGCFQSIKKKVTSFERKKLFTPNLENYFAQKKIGMFKSYCFIFLACFWF